MCGRTGTDRPDDQGTKADGRGREAHTPSNGHFRTIDPRGLAVDSQFELLTTMAAGAAGAVVAVLLVGGPLWVVLPAVLGVGLAAWVADRRHR
jgi:hypothetical protein